MCMYVGTVAYTVDVLTAVKYVGTALFTGLGLLKKVLFVFDYYHSKS